MKSSLTDYAILRFLSNFNCSESFKVAKELSEEILFIFFWDKTIGVKVRDFVILLNVNSNINHDRIFKIK